MKTYIKSEREKRKILQKDLAADLHISPPTLALYENTDRDPPLDVLCAIADKFDVSLDLLVRGKEKDRPGGRSLHDLISDYENLPNEVLERNIAVSQMLLAERRLQAHSQTDGKENP